VINRTLHRVRPSGSGPQTMTTIRCFCPRSGPAHGPDAASRTELNPSPVPRSVEQWRAPSSALRLRSRPPAPPSAHCRAGAKWKPGAALARTPAPCSTSRPPAACLLFPTQYEHGDRSARSSYAIPLVFRKVPTKVHLYIVGDLGTC
jgi:hypothetical protein